MNKKVKFKDLGLIDYKKCWDYQEELFLGILKVKSKNRKENTDNLTNNYLLFCEHPHVYTLGRSGNSADILVSRQVLRQIGAGVHHVDRGGEVTYHGPGQLVGYPIVNLRSRGMGPLEYVRSIETVLTKTLEGFGIRACNADMPTGVWVGDHKVASIGVKVSKGVTAHGFALNVSPDLSYFDHIVSCGMQGAMVTSMSSLNGIAYDVQSVGVSLEPNFGEVFGMDMVWSTLGGLSNFGFEGVLASSVR